MKTPTTVGLAVLSALLLTLPSLSAGSNPQDPPREAEPSVSTSVGVAWGDANADGRADAFVIDGEGRGRLLVHRGLDGLVADETALPLAHAAPLSWAGWQDVDQDGREDLVLLTRTGVLRLLRNDPELGFLDVTEDLGLRLAGVQGVHWLDVDGDGTPDLVTHADDGTRLHTNREGRFEEQRFAGPRASGPLAAGLSHIDDAPLPTTGGGADGTAPSGSGTRGTVAGPGDGRRPEGRIELGVTPTFGPTPLGDAGMAQSCTNTLRDATTGLCISASSSPALGNLYPMSTQLNVDENDGRVGINTSRATAQLSVFPSGSDDAGHFGGPFSVGRYVLNTFFPRAELGLDGTDGGTLSLRLPDDTPTVELRASQFGGDGAALNLYNLQGIETVELDADTISDAAAMVLKRANGATGIWLEADDSGTEGSQLSLYTSTTTPSIRLTAEEGVGNGAQLDLAMADGTQTIVLDAEIGSAAAELSLFNRSGVETFEVFSQEGSANGSQLRMATDSGTTTVLVDAETTNAAELSLFASNGIETFEIVSEEVAGTGSQLRMATDGGVTTVLLDADGTTSAEFNMYSSSGTETVEIRAEETPGTGAQIVLRKEDGTAAIVLDAEQGTTGRITTEVLEITGGADLVESFDTGDETCEPGSVVVIDPTRTGELMLSTQAYDRRVAGIVSGAGNVRPGLHMGQTGVASGDTPVALTGRVYVKACDENGAIRPGDLLTTSSRSGYAMRATDPAASFGATLGKAMSALDDESGLVLVLVGLQ